MKRFCTALAPAFFWLIACAQSAPPAAAPTLEDRDNERQWRDKTVETPRVVVRDIDQEFSEYLGEPPPKAQPLDNDLPNPEEKTLLALEQAILEEVNGLRRDPKNYVATLAAFRNLYKDGQVHVPGQIPIFTAEGTAAVDEAMQIVETTKASSGLQRSPALSRAARAHARYLGTVTRLSHMGSDGSGVLERMSRYGAVKGLFSESIAAGYDRPELLVADLLVDDNLPTRMNRANLLASMFTTTGIGCAVHPRYQVVCVVVFAEMFEN